MYIKLLLILFTFTLHTIGQTKLIEKLNNGKFLVLSNKKFSISNDSVKPFFEFDSICKSRFKDYYFSKRNNLWGIIDENSKIIIPNLYENINTACCYDEYRNSDNKDNFIVNKKNKVGVVKYNNKIIVPIIYDKISNWVEYGPKAHYVLKNNKIGLISHKGKIMIPVVYDSIYYLHDKIIKAKKDNKLGIINSKNKIIIPFDNDELIVDFNIFGSEKLDNHIDKFVIKKNNIWYFIDFNGNIIRSNIPDIEIRNKYSFNELNNYDFQYIGKILNRNHKNNF